MDKIGDYFYLVIIGIVVLTRIISGISKARQNKTTTENETTTSPPPISSDWEEVLRELRGEENVPSPPKPVIELPKKKKKEKPVTSDVLEVTTAPITKTVAEEEPTNDDNEELGALLTDANDARKAFILSEILQKKY